MREQRQRMIYCQDNYFFNYLNVKYIYLNFLWV